MVSLVEVRNMLEQKFINSRIMIEDTMGDGNHFEAIIISDAFEGQTQQERHKMVYDCLGSIVGKEIHALSLSTKTFAEDSDASLEKMKSYETFVPSVQLDNDILKKIDEAIKKYDVILFMKGTKEQPMCGFSSHVVQILKSLSVEFMDVNVLASNEIRENIKIYSSWNTVPQLFVKGYFVGGCDIINNMYQDGELIELLKAKNISYSTIKDSN